MDVRRATCGVRRATYYVRRSSRAVQFRQVRADGFAGRVHQSRAETLVDARDDLVHLANTLRDEIRNLAVPLFAGGKSFDKPIERVVEGVGGDLR